MTAPNLSEHPWMEHAETGHRAQLPDIEYWRANGWSPVDGPPPEPDLTRDPPPEDPKAPDADAPGLSAAQPKKSAKPAVKPAKTEEGESDR
jgi:hypothetical protein